MHQSRKELWLVLWEAEALQESKPFLEDGHTVVENDGALYYCKNAAFLTLSFLAAFFIHAPARGEADRSSVR